MMLILLVTCIVQQTLAYYQRSDNTCAAILAQCNLVPSCSRLYESYMDHCQDVLQDLSSDSCHNRCKKSLRKLVEHSTYSRFSECECRGNAMCIRQKCKLLEACLGEECNERVTLPSVTVTPPYEGPSFTEYSSTPSGHSITMSSSTVSLLQGNCETVIVRCNASPECDVLLTRRDEQCSGYRIDGSTACTKDCTDANTDLRNDNIGIYMTTCKFETVEIDSSRFSSLINTCVDEVSAYETESPSYTERGSSAPLERPIGDCKRQYYECRRSSSCTGAYTRVMEQCKRKNRQDVHVSQCTRGCLNAVQEFRRLSHGEALWTCNCDYFSSDTCQQIRGTIADICTGPGECRDERSDCAHLSCWTYADSCKQSCGLCSASTEGTSEPPLSTDTYTVNFTELTSPPESSPGPSRYYTVNWTCEDYEIKVTIDYSAESGAAPHIHTRDKDCTAVSSGTDRDVMLISLQYDSVSCGMDVVGQANDVRFKNTIFVRSPVDNNQSSRIANIDCPAPRSHILPSVTDKLGSVAMNFYKDQLFSEKFQSMEIAAGAGVVDLGDSKTVYVELDGGNVSTQAGHHVVLDSCYATPNGKAHYSSPHYFIRDGCRKDQTFKMHNFNDMKAFFSFYRMRFADHDPGMVFVHCEVIVCNKGDPDCRLNCPMDQAAKFKKYTVLQGPYTFSWGARSTVGSLTLVLAMLLLTAT